MAGRGPHDRRGQRRLEFDVDSTVMGRVARWIERSRVLRARVEQARASHASIDLGFDVIERDAVVGGGLLAGALAYRLFVLLLPTALLLVSGLGLYADAADKTPATVAREAGLHGLVASQVSATASSDARWLVVVLMVPAILYALAKLYRALSVTHAIVWLGSGRGARMTPKGVGLLGGVVLTVLVAAEAAGLARRHSEVGGLIALFVYLVLVGGAWLVFETALPHRAVSWTGLVPGAALVGVGVLCINVFNVYVTNRLVEGRANTYGALGVAAALLFSLVLVGRLAVVSAELNAALQERRERRSRPRTQE
jgi:membrane protein